MRGRKDTLATLGYRSYYKYKTTGVKKSSSQDSQSPTPSDHYYYPPKQETELGEESEIYSSFPIATVRTNKSDLKVVEKFFLDLLEENEISDSIPKSKEEINYSKVDKPSSSKLPVSIEEIQEENLNEETAEVQEGTSSTARIHQKILEMQEQLLALIKREGKIKSSSYTPQNSSLKEQTSLKRSFRPHGSPSPYPRPISASKSYTEQRPSSLPSINISSQIPTPLQEEIPQDTTPIVKIRAQDYSLGFDGKDVEIFIKKAENIAEIEGASGRDIAKQISSCTKDEEISYHN
ncbi:hypothetical protein O181_017779 [Austropuccinia psidii MF-1]|uniref:Uncharacterized protein n=1 Tax=Austropuccinia psidii MF-1 TaxID=1389203 RepID=A0A9Q3C413_9BASI|nr:hypothetical protein [Austropuccinia psidii MF-1]